MKILNDMSGGSWAVSDLTYLRVMGMSAAQNLKHALILSQDGTFKFADAFYDAAMLSLAQAKS